MSKQTSHALTQTRIKLGSLKVTEFASEETLCFSAIILFDGERVGQASNEGHGGATTVRPLGTARQRLAEAGAFAESLPPDDLEYTQGGKVRSTTIPMTLEYLVDCIASEMADERRFRRYFKRAMQKVLYVRDQQLFELKGVKLPAASDRASLFSKLRSKHGKSIVILADLPTDQAFALWKQHAVKE